MDDNTIEHLREALRISPGNVPLKLHLADTLLSMKRLDEAEKEFAELLKITRDQRVKTGLAKVFFQQGKYSQCNVILEESMESGHPGFEEIILYSRALVREGSTALAIEYYKKALDINPGFHDVELDNALRSKSSTENLSDDNFETEGYLERPTINFDDVGGMDAVKKEIGLKIIQPLKHPELYKAYGKKTGGGILLYGPPGCGKTYIARATAGQVNAKFINVGLNDVLDMWIGNSEKNLHEIFEIARANQPCVLFFDEIDALGASRTDMRQSSGRHLINQFLQELDGVESNNDGVLVLGATNTPWHLDPAFRRPGRFDRIIFVPPPDAEARASILQLKLKDKPTEKIDFQQLAKKLDNYSGADIEAVIDIAIEEKLEKAFIDGIPGAITGNDLLSAAKKHKASTQEWFSTAKNFALFANDSGLYDDILHHLKIKK